MDDSNSSGAAAPHWQLSPVTLTPDDPLLGCLLVVARMHERAASPDTLTAGLPLIDRRLTPELFLRAATRIGLVAQVVPRALDEISDLVLPAVLLLKGRGACVLVRRLGEARALVVQPESGGQVELSIAELREAYAGKVIFARPEHRFDARTEDSALPRAKHWFWGVVAQAWPLYSEVLVASLLLNLFALVMPLFTMNVYDRVVPNRVMETLWALAAGVIVVIGFDFVIRSLRGYFIDMAGKRIDLVLSSTIFEKVLGIRMAARPASVGSFASSVQEFEAFREFVTSATITTVVDLPFVLLFVATIFWIGGPIGWLVVLAIPLVVGVSLLLQRPIAALVQASYKFSAQRQAMLVESLVALETIKVVGAAGSLQRRWEQVIAQLGVLGLRSRMLSTMAVNFSSLITQLVNVAVVVYGIYLMESDALTTGSLIACTILAGRALAPLAQVAQLVTRYHQSRTALASISRLMELPVERPAEQSFLVRPRLTGAIEFRNVSFKYPGATVEALHDISFRIGAGERVGIIGRVGSGKTTIEKLILGLYQPDEGSVLLDGTELRQMDPAAVRRDIGYVPQDTMLFYGSVRDNITYGAPFVDDAAVLRAAQLGGVTEFVSRLPQGFDLVIGERGEGLSGGQRQAVVIARASLLDPPILLFDEPTSAMDSRSEEQFKARLEARLDGRTLVLVTHRPSLLSLVNRLIVVEGGRMVADGPREAVIAALAGGKINAVAR